MASKFFTWTKGDRRNAAEAYQSYRVDGLMPVDQYQWDSPTDVSLSKKRKVSSMCQVCMNSKTGTSALIVAQVAVQGPVGAPRAILLFASPVRCFQ